MPTPSQEFAVLSAHGAPGRRWRALWAAWPHAGVFAHPTYLERFGAMGATHSHIAQDADAQQIGVRPLGDDVGDFGAHSTQAAGVHSPGTAPRLVADVPQATPARISLAVLESAEGVVAMPFLLRLDALGTDVVGPYGYGGAFRWGDRPPVDDFWAAFDRWCAETSVVAEFHRLHLDATVPAPHPGTERVRGANVVRELASDDDAIWAEVDRSVRKNVRSARRAGVRIEVDDHVGRTDDLTRLHAATMRRRDAGAAYALDAEAVLALAADLPGHVAIATAHLGDRVVAAELLLVSGTRAYSFLGGSDVDALAARPNDLLKLEVMRWARDRGLDAFVLGGGRRPGDGIERFKRGFAPNGIVPFRTVERVHDAVAYRAATADAGAVADDGGYFPAYRAPRRAA